tara:strand:- start:27 stop:218 length:192 start_codon:yes stop_codon:yes gene_type:complete
MTLRIKKLYHSGSRNEQFLKDILAADGDKKPGIFSNDIEKTLFATIYYGWLVAQYGVTWESKL